MAYSMSFSECPLGAVLPVSSSYRFYAMLWRAISLALAYEAYSPVCAKSQQKFFAELQLY